MTYTDSTLTQYKTHCQSVVQQNTKHSYTQLHSCMSIITEEVLASKTAECSSSGALQFWRSQRCNEVVMQTHKDSQSCCCCCCWIRTNSDTCWASLVLVLTGFNHVYVSVGECSSTTHGIKVWGPPRVNSRSSPETLDAAWASTATPMTRSCASSCLLRHCVNRSPEGSADETAGAASPGCPVWRSSC